MPTVCPSAGPDSRTPVQRLITTLSALLALAVVGYAGWLLVFAIAAWPWT